MLVLAIDWAAAVAGEGVWAEQGCVITLYNLERRFPRAAVEQLLCSFSNSRSRLCIAAKQALCGQASHQA